MLALSSMCKKPVILHSRDALPDLLTVIDEWFINSHNIKVQQNPLHGVFHMFEGDGSSAEVIIAKGFQISIGGNITYKNNTRSVELLKSIGLSSLLLETDTPYMTPVPFRGIPNEPSRIPLIAEKVADILQIKVELVAEVTTNNAKRLFSLR
jgi:TatD DNase family protein